jgi:hypothetical protein
VWQLQYLRAREIAADRLAEADRDRLARAARIGPSLGPTRRVIATGARLVERTATSVAAWADPRPV